MAHPASAEIIQWNTFTGRLAAVNSVEIRARVSGYLQSVTFNEGDFVQKGDLLFVIDPRPYQAEFERTQGQLATAEAKERLTQIELGRAKQLLEQKAYSQETYDQKLAAERQAAGELQSAKAAVNAASLNLEFTTITAPISGKISRVLVTPGNLIDGGSSQSTLLTTLVSLNPLYCYFTVDEAAHLRWVRLLQEGKLPRNVKFPIWFALGDESGYPHLGHIDFVDNRIDANTATLNMRAIVPNPDRMLRPGLFVRVRVPASGIFQATLVPDQAITSDQAQKIAYVVNSENKVERRNVVIGSREQDLRVVKEGLSRQDRVVIRGIQRARVGQTVKPEETTLVFDAKDLVPKEVRDILDAHTTRTSLQIQPANTGP